MFPRPMPVHHDAKLFPRLFSSNRSMGAAFLPLDSEIAPLEENRSFFLEGTLCFQLVDNISVTTPCIPIYNQTAGWFDLPEDSPGPCYEVGGQPQEKKVYPLDNQNGPIIVGA